MQITFDPLNDDEAQAVARFLNRDTEIVQLRMPAITADQIKEITRSMGSGVTNVTNVLNHADRPDVGAMPEVPLAPSAAPLPPDAPSFAAVDLFPNVPAAGSASVPPAPPVPSPPVPPVPPAPPAPAAPAGPTNPVELDKNGLPWDERIHAGTKAKNADGSWRQRRGLNDEALIKRVEAELRALLANNATSAAPFSQPITIVAVGKTDAESAGELVAKHVPAVPPVPAAATASVPPPPVTPVTPPAVPAPPVPAGASTPTAASVVPAELILAPATTFAGVIDVISKSIAKGFLTEAQINAELEAEGVAPTAIGTLAGDPVKTLAVGKRLHVL